MSLYAKLQQRAAEAATLHAGVDGDGLDAEERTGRRHVSRRARVPHASTNASSSVMPAIEMYVIFVIGPPTEF